MATCPKCSGPLKCVCENCGPEVVAGTAAQPCPRQNGALWVQVYDDQGEAVSGVRISVEGVGKPTDANGLAAWDPLPSKVYTARLEALSEELSQQYRSPANSAVVANVRDGEVALASFVLPRIPLTWIEIELLGEDNSPVAGASYRITLPNAEIREGQLDGSGRARIEGIPAGQCEVRFPELDRDAWALA